MWFQQLTVTLTRGTQHPARQASERARPVRSAARLLHRSGYERQSDEISWWRGEALRVRSAPSKASGESSRDEHTRANRGRVIVSAPFVESVERDADPYGESTRLPCLLPASTQTPSAEMPDTAESASKAHVLKLGRAQAHRGGESDIAWPVARAARSHRFRRGTEWSRCGRAVCGRDLQGSVSPDELTRGSGGDALRTSMIVPAPFGCSRCRSVERVGNHGGPF